MKKLVALVSLTGVLVPALSFAAYLNAGSNISVTGAETSNQNAYVVGGSVNISGPVGGDLLVAGGNVLVSSKAGRDIMAGGGTVNLINAEAEDVRIAGGNVMVSAAIAGEAMIAGGQVVVNPETRIAKDSAIVGGTINFLGNEAGNLTLSGGEIRIDGTIAGDVVIKRAQKVTLGSHAVLKKTLTYTASQAMVREEGSQIAGAVTFHQMEAPAKTADGRGILAGFIAFWSIMKFLAILAAAYLLWYVRRNDVKAVLEEGKNRFWHSLLRGFAFMVLVPIASIILLFALVGSVPAMVALLAYVAILVLTAPFASLFVASLLMKGKTDLAWYHILLGSLVLMIVSIIPFLGWLAGCVVYLTVLGGVTRILGHKFRDNG